MSEAKTAFDEGIRDAEQLLEYFTRLNAEDSAAREVLKRVGLIMACTARETYVENRASESLTARIAARRRKRIRTIRPSSIHRRIEAVQQSNHRQDS